MRVSAFSPSTLRCYVKTDGLYFPRYVYVRIAGFFATGLASYCLISVIYLETPVCFI